jgi:hypothetical protein
VLKHVRRACVRVVASIFSLPNYYDRGQWKQRGLFFTEQTSHTTSRFFDRPAAADYDASAADAASAAASSEGTSGVEASSGDHYKAIRPWLGKVLIDALGTVRDATTLQLLLHVLAQKVLEDSRISPGIAQIAISLIAGRITLQVRASWRGSLVVLGLPLLGWREEELVGWRLGHLGVAVVGGRAGGRGGDAGA